MSDKWECMICWSNNNPYCMCEKCYHEVMNSARKETRKETLEEVEENLKSRMTREPMGTLEIGAHYECKNILRRIRELKKNP